MLKSCGQISILLQSEYFAIELALVCSHKGHGEYERLDLELSSLPPLWLAFVADPSDSGRMHSNIRQRWLDNDPAVLDGMRKFADYTLQGKVALLAGKYEEFMDLMYVLVDQRKLSLYGWYLCGFRH